MGREFEWTLLSQTKIHSYHPGCSPLKSPHSLSSELLPEDLPPIEERSPLLFSKYNVGIYQILLVQKPHGLPNR